MRRDREMRFTKIKFDGLKVRLEYEVTHPRGGTPDEYAVCSSDKPLPDFSDALQVLIPDVLHICEFPPSEAGRFTMRGVSLAWKDGAMGACLTALRSLTTTNTPLIINSPFLSSTTRESDPGGCRLPARTVRRLQALIAEADRYLCGERLLVDGGDA